MKISIASYSFHGSRSAGVMDAFGYMEACKHRYRLDSADFWNGILGPDDLVWQEEFQKKVKDGLAERELELVNYHVDGCHIWEDDPARREKHYQSALKHLKVGAFLGARTMRIDAGSRAAAWTAEQFDHIVKRYKEFCAFAADHGFRIGPENHWGPEKNIGEMERLIKAVDHPAFGILLHLGRWDGGEPADCDARVARWAVHTHVTPQVHDRLAAALRMLAAAGYQGYFGVEDGPGKNEYANVATQVAILRQAMEKLRLGL